MNKQIKRVICSFLAAVLLLSFFSFFCSAENEKPFENSEFFTFGAYTLHYRVFEATNEKGKIMMIHGFCCSTCTWQDTADELCGDGYTCVLVDLPGFGYSTRETEISDEKYVGRETLVVELMKSIAPIDEWIVAGHSMGGGVAMNIACAQPQIKSLVLVCPAPVSTVPQAMKPLMLSKPMTGMMNFVFEYLTRITPLLRIVAMAAFWNIAFTMKYDLSLITNPLQIHNTGKSNLLTMFRAMPTDLDAVSRLKMPVLLIQAKHDLVLMPSMKTDVAAALPNAKTYEIDAGHLCLETHSKEIADIINNSL